MTSKLKATTTETLVNNGSLPKGWRMVRFDELAQIVNERVDPSATDAEIYVGLEHLDPDSLKLRRWGMPGDVIGDKLQFRKGDIIFGRRRAYQRKLAVAEFDGICSAHAMVIRAKADTVVPDFLPFLMQSDVFMQRAIDISVGSLSPTINWKTLRIQEFPLPSKEEQRRLAEILWATDETCDKWRSVVVEGTQAFQLLLDDLVSGGNSQEQDYSSWVAPSGWKLLTVGDVVKFQGGSQPPRDTFEYSPREGNIRLIQIRDYKSDEFATYIPTEAARRFCTADDVMIGRYGPPIFQILRGLEGSYNVALIKAIPIGEITKDYLYYFLRQSSLFLLIEHLSQRSSGQTGIDMEALRKFPFPVPPKNVQTQILDIVHKAERSICDVEAHIRRQKQLASRLFVSALDLRE